MNTLLEHAKRELKLAGYDITEKGCNPKNPKTPMDGYANICARAAYELIETLSKQGHSGMSVGITLSLFNKLAKYDVLTPITNNPNEWSEYTTGRLQNIRKSSCFSDDNLKTYYDIDADENYDIVMENDVIKSKVRKNQPWITHNFNSEK